ncbi:MAG: hypothetical protein LBJ22_02240 [Synergistaceae bacterium]|nr:hypothetical protein [Synergistaceae bacterium]
MTGDVKREAGPNKARKGVALALALLVVLVGGTVIALTFDFVYRFFWTSTQQRGIYVDHTTVLSAVQAKIAQIIQHNISEGKTMHVPALGYDSDGEPPAEDSLRLRDLLFGEPWRETIELKSEGSGPQRVETEVFDMHFKPEWVDYDAFRKYPDEMRDFPPVFNMVRDRLEPNDPPQPPLELPPDQYGAYLIRVRLYDHQNKLIRTAEEAFVQILPEPETDS